MKLSVADVKFCVAKAPSPIAVDLEPKVSPDSAAYPTTTFLSASVRESPAELPIIVFRMPVVIALAESDPMAVL